MKRFISMMLALVMVLVLLPVTALAAGNDIAYPVTGGNIYFNKETGTITGSDKSITEAIIPISIEGTPVKTIGSYAFSACSKLTKVILPVGLTTIEGYAFCDCSSLSSIIIPETVSSFGEYVFWKDNELKTAGPREGLKNYNIKYDWKSIPSHAFHACDGLIEITISNSVTNIDKYAFFGLSRLSSINVEFGNSYFSSEDGVLFSKDMKQLIMYPSGKDGLQYNIPDGVTEIANYAFFSANLASITLPQSVSSVGLTALSSPSLIQINVDNGNNMFCSIDGVLLSKDQKTLIAYPNGKGDSYRIPDGVTTIGDGAFYGWYGNSIIIPSSVTKIGYEAFGLDHCTINYCGTEEQWKHVSVDSHGNDIINSTTVHYNYQDNSGGSGVPNPPAQGDQHTTELLFAKFKAIDVFTNTIYLYDNVSAGTELHYKIADGAAINVNGMMNKWVICEIQKTSTNSEIVSIEIANIRRELYVTVDTIPVILYREFNNRKQLGFSASGFESYSVFEIPIKVTLVNNVFISDSKGNSFSTTSGIPSVWVDRLRSDKSFDYKITKLNVKIPEGFNFGIFGGGQPEESKEISLGVGYGINLGGYIRADSSYVPSNERNEYSITGSIETNDGVKNFTIPFTIEKTAQSSSDGNNTDDKKEGSENELSWWDEHFLKELYSIKDVKITAQSVTLQQYFDKDVVDSIGKTLAYWLAVRDSEFADKVGKLPAYLKIDCKMNDSYSNHDASIIFTVRKERYGVDKKFDWEANFDQVLYTLIDNNTHRRIVKDGLQSFSVSASAKDFADEMKSYLTKECGESLKDFCKKLGEKALKSIITDTAKITGKEYLNTMLDILKNAKTIMSNANKFREHAEKVSDVISSNIKAVEAIDASEFDSIVKKVTIKCPVDVYVYKPDGKLCASIVNNKVSQDSDELFMEINGDQKTLWLNNNYRISLVSTDSGKMDYEIEEFATFDSDRKVSFYDVPLSKGITYTASIPEKNNVSATQFALTSNSGKTIYANSDTANIGSLDNPFTDISKNQWYFNSVLYVNKKGLMTGKTTTKFAPNDTATRAEVSTVLWRMDDELQANFALQYTDVKENAWYTEAVRWATAAEVVTGYSGNKFGPSDSVTREQFATMLYRYAQYKKLDVKVQGNPLSKFPDAGKVGTWAKDAMAWAVDRGIITGADGKLDPKGSAVRAQLAAMIERFDKLS